jgi:hypothetical protein
MRTRRFKFAIDRDRNQRRQEMRRTTTLAVILTFAVSILLAPGAVGAEEEGQAGRVEYRHRAEIFLGVAHEESSDEFAAGIGYEYRISSLLGVGGFVEHAGETEDTWTFGAPLFLHPYKGVRFLLAPGWEAKEIKVEEEVPSEGRSAFAEATEDKGAEKTENEHSFLVRTGVAYELEFGRWSITPEFNADLVEGGHQVLVYGVSFGCGF